MSEYVDPITGEIIPDDATIKHLPNIGNWLRSNARKLEHLFNPKPIKNGIAECLCKDCNLGREYQKLKEQVEHRQAEHYDDRMGLEQRAQNIFASTGERVIEYPDFRFR